MLTNLRIHTIKMSKQTAAKMLHVKLSKWDNAFVCIQYVSNVMQSKTSLDVPQDVTTKTQYKRAKRITSNLC